MFPNNLALSQRLDGAFGTDPKNYPGQGARGVHAQGDRRQAQGRGHDGAGGVRRAAQELRREPRRHGGRVRRLGQGRAVAPGGERGRRQGRHLRRGVARVRRRQAGQRRGRLRSLPALRGARRRQDEGRAGGGGVPLQAVQGSEVPRALQNECGKEVTDRQAARGADARLQGRGQPRWQADDRELSAFDDCLRKSRKSKRSDDAGDVGRAWVAYMEAVERSARSAKKRSRDK